jgi:hypothetical protein
MDPEFATDLREIIDSRKPCELSAWHGVSIRDILIAAGPGFFRHPNLRYGFDVLGFVGRFFFGYFVDAAEV